MKDLHSHLLPGIDDGSNSMEESISLLKSAYESGITDMMLTPHYMYKTDYNCNNKKKEKLFKELKDELIKNDIPINIYLGNEIYINEDIIKLIKKGDIHTLNNTKYILVELPLDSEYKGAANTLYNLNVKGYKVILAHPERYKFLQNSPDRIKEFIDNGILLQGNYQSLFNRYGKKAKKLLKYYIKKRYITLLGSDVHKNNEFNIKKLLFKLKFIANKSYREDLLVNNFDKVINDIEI